MSYVLGALPFRLLQCASLHTFSPCYISWIAVKMLCALITLTAMPQWLGSECSPQHLFIGSLPKFEWQYKSVLSYWDGCCNCWANPNIPITDAVCCTRAFVMRYVLTTFWTPQVDFKNAGISSAYKSVAFRNSPGNLPSMGLK